MVSESVLQTAQASAPPLIPDAPQGRRNTALLLLFTAITNLADGVTKITLPLLATRVTASPALVAAVSLTLSLPWLLVALHVGVLVDRADRRRLLWLANGMRLLAVGALIQAAVGDGLSIGMLCAGGSVLGIAEVIALTAASALVPALVPPTGLEQANALITGAETVCNEFCGPFVGGLLLALGASAALGATWLSYLAASLVLIALAGRFRAARQATVVPETVNKQIVGGLVHLWRHRLLRTMALILTVLCACWGGWLALMPLYATGLMGLTPQEYGTVLSALGVGGLIGALAVTRVNRLFGHRWVMSADLAGTFAMMAVPALTTHLWAVAAAAFAGGMGGTLWSVNARTIGQRLVPDHMLGRYNAVSRLFSWGAMPLGAGLMGLLAETLGLRPAFFVFAVSVAVTVVPFLRVVTQESLAEAFRS